MASAPLEERWSNACDFSLLWRLKRKESAIEPRERGSGNILGLVG